jgi:hypothetical protein
MAMSMLEWLYISYKLIVRAISALAFGSKISGNLALLMHASERSRGARII